MEKNEVTIKVNLDTTEAIEKLEELKKQLQDVDEIIDTTEPVQKILYENKKELAEIKDILLQLLKIETKQFNFKYGYINNNNKTSN